MTLEKVQELKRKTEVEIAQLIKKFRLETGLSVELIIIVKSSHDIVRLNVAL